MATDDRALELCEEKLGYRFHDRSLLEAALTHSSYANEQGTPEQYERLEFLGDSVLGLIAAEWLYQRYPELPEGKLSKFKSYLVSAPVLAAHARAIELGAELRLGVGEERSGGRRKASLLADAMEAILGAIFLDQGLEAARAQTVPLLETAERRRAQHRHRDAKTALQELSQAQGKELPRYLHVAHEGPDHERLFMVDCWVDGQLVGSGTGRSKKLAEQQAASVALEVLRQP